MQIVTIPSETVYTDLYTLSGTDPYKTIIVTNNTSDPIFSLRSATQPADNAPGFPIYQQQTVILNGVDGETLWIRGDTGPVLVQERLSQAAAFSAVTFPIGVYTTDDVDFSRLKVEDQSTGFNEGRQFRSYFKMSLGAGTSQVLKFVTTRDFILKEQGLAVSTGSIRFTATIGATETGTFSTPVPSFGKNRMSFTPVVTSEVTITTGGSFTGGTEVELFEVVAATATAQQATVGPLQGSDRGLPVGTFFLKFTNFGQGTAEAVYNLFWEEIVV